MVALLLTPCGAALLRYNLQVFIARTFADHPLADCYSRCPSVIQVNKKKPLTMPPLNGLGIGTLLPVLKITTKECEKTLGLRATGSAVPCEGPLANYSHLRCLEEASRPSAVIRKNANRYPFGSRTFRLLVLLRSLRTRRGCHSLGS